MKTSDLAKTSNGVKKIIWLGLILIAILAASGCSLYGNNQAIAPRQAPLTAQPATPAPDNDPGEINPVATPPVTTPDNDSGAVNIENFAFSPSTITVKKGAVITWTNNDSAPHKIKSATFNSGVLNKGQSFSFTFNETGTFNYICSIHPAMTGRIIVE